MYRIHEVFSLLLVFITHAPHRMEIAGIAAVFFEVFTEIKDEIINGACGGINVISPNRLQDFFSCNNLVQFSD